MFKTVKFPFLWWPGVTDSLISSTADRTGNRKINVKLETNQCGSGRFISRLNTIQPVAKNPGDIDGLKGTASPKAGAFLERESCTFLKKEKQ